MSSSVHIYFTLRSKENKMSIFNGKKISITLFGQSHSEAIGVTIDGLPAGIPVDEAEIAAFMKRRAPSASAFSTSRAEPDVPVFVSGVMTGVTTGAALTAVIYNKDQRSRDYSALVNTPRPGHADYTARVKYGGAEDYRGGGAFSGRMTAPLCVAGAVAVGYLKSLGITIGSHILSIGDVCDGGFDPVGISADELEAVISKPFPVKDDEKGAEMLEFIARTRADGDSVGGVIECAAVGVPVGLGGELFDGIEATLARLVFSVPAVKGFEIGAGFNASRSFGSKNNDEFYFDGDKVKTRTNNAGGILGGITSGMPVTFKVAIKPTPSISKPQKTVDLSTRKDTEITIGGRHDACIVPRALPVIEACLSIAVLDEIL